MTFAITLPDAQAQFPDYTFIKALTPSAQKAAFHVRDQDGHDLCLKMVAPTYERDRLDREILAMQTIDHPNVVRLRDTRSPRSLDSSAISSSKSSSMVRISLTRSCRGSLGRSRTQFSSSRSCAMGLLSLRARASFIATSSRKTFGSPDGTPVIIDFGLARHLGLPDLTKTLQGARSARPRTFRRSNSTAVNTTSTTGPTFLARRHLAVHEATVGEQPFIDSTVHTVAQLRDAVCDRDDHLKRPAFLALDGTLQVLIGKLLEKQRAKRPADAAQVATILRKIGAGVTP